MKISFKGGKKCEGDKLFFIETNEEEPFNHARLMILLNQLAKNEWLIYKEGEWDERGKDFLFPLAVEDAIEKGRQGIDFLDDEFEPELKKFCDYHFLKFEKFKQSKLNDFFKKDEN